MSLSETLSQNVQNIVESFIGKIVEKYSVDREEVLSLWTGGTASVSTKPKAKPKPKTELATVDMDDISIERLNSCNKGELVALCKSRGCKCTGTKEVLIARLLGKEDAPSKATKAVKSSEKTAPKTVVKGKKAERAAATVDVVKKLTADIPVIPIRRNVHNNLEHPETGLVFDRKTEMVIGKQQEDGTIADLTDEDIEACKRFKFKYNIPDNLDKKDNLDNVKIEELGDDSDIEVEIEADDDEEVEIDDEEGEEEDEDIEDDD